MANQLWTRDGGNAYVIEASDLKYQLELRCPYCKEPLPYMRSWQREFNEREVVSWKLAHACGANLTIFND